MDMTDAEKPLTPQNIMLLQRYRWGGALLMVGGTLFLLYPYLWSLSALLQQKQLHDQWMASQRTLVADSTINTKLSGSEKPLHISATPAKTSVRKLNVARKAINVWPARLSVGRIGMDLIILDGVDHGTLSKAPWHFPGTALPGGSGNCVLLGHRFISHVSFRMLRDIKTGDSIKLEDKAGCWTYQVTSTRLVSAQTTSVLDPTQQSILTLITCDGLRSERRLVVVAHLQGIGVPTRLTKSE